MNFFLLRLASVAVVGGLTATLPWHQLESFFVAFLFAHYALSFYYAKDTVGNLMRARTAWWPLAGLTFFSAAFLLSGYYVLALVPFIGLHIALSDTYMINDKLSFTSDKDQAARSQLNLSRFAIGVSVFLLVLHAQPVFARIPIALIHTGLAISFIYFCTLPLRHPQLLSGSVGRDFIAFEALGVTLAYAIYFANLDLTAQHFVFYHIVLWTIFPTSFFWLKRDKIALRKFAALTVSITGLFYWLALPVETVPLWASLHFLSSFALSRHNPRLITKYFYQRIHS